MGRLRHAVTVRTFYAAGRGLSTCSARGGPPNVPTVDIDDLTPRVIVRGMLGAGALVALGSFVFVFIVAHYVEWRLVTLAVVLWTAWGFFDNVEPLGRFLAGQFAGDTRPPDTPSSPPPVTIAQETATLERLLTADPPPPAHRVVLAGIRLAEIYRTCEHDAAKADALLARLATQYPDAPELKYVPPPATD
jgi:hypothetical protein